MMDYEMFKAVVKENFLRYLPEEYRDGKPRILKAKKVNRILDGLSVIPADGSQTLPTIYINKMYEHYRACGDLESVLRDAAQQYAQRAESSREQHPKGTIGVPMEYLKDNVIMCLINTEQNRELLADVKNRAFHDLSVIYRWVLDSAPDGIESVIVTNNVAERAGMTEGELFRCAVENTRHMYPVTVTCMGDLFGRIPEGIAIPPEIREEMERANRTAGKMWIISNSSGIFGAASMLYEENLHQLAEKLGEDLFIFPSSIHEVIAIPAEMADKNLTHLVEMVQEVNLGSLRLEDRLSNSVYHYDREARKVTLAAESPEKRLDGKPAELPLIQEDGKTR